MANYVVNVGVDIRVANTKVYGLIITIAITDLAHAQGRAMCRVQGGIIKDIQITCLTFG